MGVVGILIIIDKFSCLNLVGDTIIKRVVLSWNSKLKGSLSYLNMFVYDWFDLIRIRIPWGWYRVDFSNSLIKWTRVRSVGWNDKVKFQEVY